jgi:ATP-dependent DNA ligase
LWSDDILLARLVDREGGRVRYQIVAEAYRDLEAASARLALIERLAALVRQTPDELLPTVALLCQGQIAPDFAGVELGLADRLATRAVATAAGVICKSLDPQAHYQAGARGWQWIKLKRDYRSELSDTLDLVVVGGLAGRGRRAGMYGALLLAVYDQAADRFQTICKCGTGFSDAELAALPERLAPLAREGRPARVDSRWHADVWFQPALVVEVLAAELTVSPHHTAAWGLLKEDSGLALRFPRFTSRWREDKTPTDATTVAEVVEMFRTARRAPAGA